MVLLLLIVTDVPQSNQRGIETRPGSGFRWARTGPQSNQRGIETILPHEFIEVGEASLNRTSVGLKRRIPLPDCVPR